MSSENQPESSRNFPRVLLVLLAVITTVFLGQLLLPPFNRFALHFLALDTTTFIRHYRLWQAVTAIFLHGSLLHLLGNVLFLVGFGIWLARAWRWREFLGYFLFCGVCGNLCFFVYTICFGDGACIGASGAVFGIMIAAAMVFGEVELQLFGVIPLKMKTLVAICFAIEIVLLLAATIDGIAHVTHLGGALAGAGLLKLIWRLQAPRAGQSAVPTPRASRIRGLEFIDHESSARHH